MKNMPKPGVKIFLKSMSSIIEVLYFMGFNKVEIASILKPTRPLFRFFLGSPS